MLYIAWRVIVGGENIKKTHEMFSLFSCLEQKVGMCTMSLGIG